MKQKLKVFESFSGYGSQRMALRNLGIEFESVGISEIDIPAVLSYASIHDGLDKVDDTFAYPSKEEMIEYLEQRNIGLDFKTKKVKLPKNLIKLQQIYRATVLSKCFGDISLIDPINLPDMDLFTYSFPCTDISVAGQQQGVIKGQTRSGLLYECEKIIEVKRPKYLLMENVKNLVGKKFKEQFDEWLEYLESLGYTNYWKVLNSRDFGVPQNRERVFVLSILGEHDPYEFHSGFELDIRLKDVLESNIDEKYYINTDRANQLIQKLYNTGQITDDVVPCDSTILNPKALEVGNCITARYDAGIQNKGSIGIAVCEAVSSKRIGGMFDDENNNENNINIVIGSTQKNAYIGNGEMSPTLTSAMGTGGGHTPMIGNIPNYRIRKLTPKECWRLMGCSDEDFEKAKLFNSDSQLYKQAGNSIVVNVLEGIFANMFCKE